MTFEQFINKWNGKYVERYDPSNVNQCIDLVLQYIDEVCGLGNLIPLGIVRAYDLWTKNHKLKPYCSYHTNEPTAIPHAGDIIVWSSKYGPDGHTAVATGLTAGQGCILRGDGTAGRKLFIEAEL